MGGWFLGWYDDRRGTAAIEFALLMPVLMLILLGLADYAALATRSVQVRAAAHAGAAWAARHGWDARAITAAADAGLATLDDPRAGAELVSGCLNADGRISPQSRCADGSAPGRWVHVRVTARAAPMLLRSEQLFPDSVAGDALVRIG